MRIAFGCRLRGRRAVPPGRRFPRATANFEYCRCSVSGRGDQACAEHGRAGRSCLRGILCRRRQRQREVERGGTEGPRNRRCRGLRPRLSGRRHHTVFATVGSGKQPEKQYPLRAGHGAERRNCPRDRIPAPRATPPASRTVVKPRSSIARISFAARGHQLPVRRRQMTGAISGHRHNII